MKEKKKPNLELLTIMKATVTKAIVMKVIVMLDTGEFWERNKMVNGAAAVDVFRSELNLLFSPRLFSVMDLAQSMGAD